MAGLVVAWLTLAVTAVTASAQSQLAWADLLTSGSPAEIAPFYTRVFGWTAETLGEGRDAYVRLSNGDHPVAGIAHRPSGVRGLPRTRWLGFLSVPDLPEASARATAAGATLLMPPRAGPGGETQAVLADPEGATFGLISGEGTNARPDPGLGDLAWPVFFAEDPFEAAKFYAALLNCQVVDDPRTPMFTGDLLLTRADRARAGVIALPGRTGKRPGWICFVRVANLEATVRAAEKEGGHTLHHPKIDLIGGRLAVVADPYGAVLGLLEVTPAKAPLPVRP